MSVTINGSSGLTANDGSVFTNASGNVGIGTGSPAGKLDVNGNIYVSGKQITNGPAFSAYGSATQSISNTTNTKIAFNTKIFDTNSNYDATTNYRFTPTVAGYYLITASIGWNGSATGYTSINIYKNGSNAFNGGYVSNSSVGPVVTASSIFLANGTTDYFEIYGSQSSGGALLGGSNTAGLSFSGCLIRGA